MSALSMKRARAREVLDREGASPPGLAILSELSRVYEKTGVLDRMTALVGSQLLASTGRAERPLRVLEIGTRDGVLIRRIAEWASRHGISVELHAVEFQESLADLARSRSTEEGIPVSIHHCASPSLRELGDDEFDVVCSLFTLHHFEEAETADLLVACDRLSRQQCLHVDLNRSRWVSGLIWLVYTVLGCRRARPDGVLSVRRSHTPREMRAMTRSLGLSGRVRAMRFPPLDWCLEIPPRRSV
jgi:2-polyprenyl-3-methyl-5-hydroxy-6-metoxy-1,4-benzoquinol methylase